MYTSREIINLNTKNSYFNEDQPILVIKWLPWLYKKVKGILRHCIHDHITKVANHTP